MFFVFLRFCVSTYSELNIILMNFCNICIIITYIVDVRYSVFALNHFSIKQFVRADTRHKNLITALN